MKQHFKSCVYTETSHRSFLVISLALALFWLVTGCSDDPNPVEPTHKTTPDFLDAVSVVQGPISNPANGHTYYRLANTNWTDAEANAVQMLGGHLVTINNATENTFVLNTFANAAGSGRVWLGLNDAKTENTFVWSSGETSAYTNWDPGEPNNVDNEDYVAMYSANGRWVDVKDLPNPPGIGQVYGVVEADAAAAIYVVQGPVTNPANGHTYYRLSNSNWTDAEAFAVNVVGGHLVTINDAAENTFVLNTFANAAGSGRVWLGLNDAKTEDTFVWSSGETSAYTNWDPGEPNNVDNEDYVAMYSANGRWVDVKDLPNPPGIGQIYGVVEVK